MAALLILAAFPLFILLDGWAISTIWNWYMPTMFGLASLSMAGALGLSCVVGIFKGMPVRRETTTKEDVITIVTSVLRVLFLVFFAWLYRHWL